MKSIIKDFKNFKGVHCETTATGSLLKQLDINLSEPMLFGLGEGLGFIYWNMKTMEFPFIGGRIKPDVLTKNICRNLNLKLEIKETSSVKKAWTNVSEFIDKGTAVGLKLDCYHLDYFTNKIHFAAHYATMYGYDDSHAYLVDTYQQGRETQTLLKNLELARNEKGPMSSKNLSYTIQKTNKSYDLKKVVEVAIRNNAKDYLNPPISNIGYKGILKTSKEIRKWFSKSDNLKEEFHTTAMLMEKAGTGGSLFRNLYRDFLRESFLLLNIKEINQAYEIFVECASLWAQVSSLFNKVNSNQDIKYINEASEVLIQISAREKLAMEVLVNI